ncbi:hypothetical protein E2128_25390 [Escherichia coli]|nr:hypothetical protein E2128_25390 [Escherichia coli]
MNGETTSTVWSLKSVLSPLCHISLSSINLSTPLTCDRRPAKAVPTGMETSKRKLTAVCSHQTRIGNLDAHLI